MKKNLILFVLIIALSSCKIVKYTHYFFSVSNYTTDSEILVSYKTIDAEEEILLHNNIEEVGQHKNIYMPHSLDGDLGQYTEEEFNDKIISVKISIINGTDTIPVSKNFAPIEYWEYRENYDDLGLAHLYQLVITDDLID